MHNGSVFVWLHDRHNKHYGTEYELKAISSLFGSTAMYFVERKSHDLETSNDFQNACYVLRVNLGQTRVKD